MKIGASFSPVNTSFKNRYIKKETENKHTQSQTDKKKKITYALAMAGALAVAGIAIASKSNKTPVVDTKTPDIKPENIKIIPEEVSEIKLPKIKFSKGIATLEDGSKFTGEINKTLNNSDNVKLVYENGKLLSSQRLGTENFTKEFIYNDEIDPDKLSKIIKKASDGTVLSETTFKHNGFGKPYEVATDKGVSRFEYDEKSILKLSEFPDGTKKQFFDGALKFETLPDGTKKSYHNSGELKSVDMPDGTSVSLYRNGQVNKKTYLDGTSEHWYENGVLKLKTYADGSKKAWYDNGQLKREISADGTVVNWSKDGTLI